VLVMRDTTERPRGRGRGDPEASWHRRGGHLP
jgi:hypothetical protein